MAILQCDRCGSNFECNPGGDCWCMSKPAAMPLPDAANSKCMCPSCLEAELSLQPLSGEPAGESA